MFQSSTTTLRNLTAKQRVSTNAATSEKQAHFLFGNRVVLWPVKNNVPDGFSFCVSKHSCTAMQSLLTFSYTQSENSLITSASSFKIHV